MVPSKEAQRQSLFLVIPNQKGGKQLETLVWIIIRRYLRKIEESGIQFGVQLYNKTSKIMYGTRICYPQGCVIVSY